MCFINTPVGCVQKIAYCGNISFRGKVLFEDEPPPIRAGS